MNNEFLETVQKTANDIFCKIEGLEDLFQRFENSVEIFNEYMNDITSEALNELLKIGVVPDARIRHHAAENREFICLGYYDDNVIFRDALDLDEKPKEYKTGIISFLKAKEKWEVVK